VNNKTDQRASAAQTGAVDAENRALLDEVDALRQHIAALEALVDSDTLTPLANRRAFTRRMEFEIRQIARHETQTTLVLLDVNGLKNVNDCYGHLAGDAVLRHLADHLLTSFRVTDLIARVGGDEFALVLDHAGEASIEARIAKLVEKLGADPLNWKGKPIAIRFAYGLTLVRADDSIDAALERADAAMYAAKQAQAFV
jgi:diguanylate cyclase (GGDEF)-like protein